MKNKNMVTYVSHFFTREQVYKDFKGWEWEFSKKRPLHILRLLVRC